MSLNRVILIGHVGQDFELKQTDSGNSVVNFRLATNTTWTDTQGQLQQRTDWHNIVAWGAQAEALAATLKKGSHIYLEGSLQNRSYDRVHKEGKRKMKVTTYVTEVVAREIRLLSHEVMNGERVAA